MKYSKGDLIKRNQYIKNQKASFISTRPVIHQGSQQIKEQNHYNSHKNLFMHHPTRVSQQRISEQRRDGDYLDIFEDEDLADPFPKLQNCKSSQELRISFKNKEKSRLMDKKRAQPKQSMQSMQSTDSLKFPLKSVSQKNLYSQDPNAEGQGEYLVIRAKNGFEDKKKQENSTLKHLKDDIKKYEDDIKRIKDENLQLRLAKMKLSSNSDIIMMIELKAEQRTLIRRLRELQGIKQDSQYDNQSITQNYKSNRVASRLESQSSIYTQSPPNSLKPSLSQLQGIKKTNTPKLLKITEPINRFSSPNIAKVQSSYLMSGGKY